MILKDEFEKPYYKLLKKFLAMEYRTKTIYPPMDDVFNALKMTPYHQVKAVILGQDPYHGPGQAHGLSFSVRPGVAIPPSLMNIYRELNNDLGCYIPNHGCLISWTKQGVLLLNTVLTVRSGSANSHRNKGWEFFTNRVIEELNNRKEPLAFLLWGNNAKEKIPLITNPVHKILTAPHPSPFSASYGFFGCRHFSKTNEWLQTLGTEPIDWQIQNMK